MPETETKDKVVQDQVDELTEPEIEVDEPLIEPEGLPESKAKVNPLSPGGRRFEQVYAESKQAKRDLAHERELRIAAEAKLSVLKPMTSEVTSSEVVEYTPAQLEEFVAQGRITRADATAHREEVLTRNLLKKINATTQIESAAATRNQTLQANINGYVQAIPAVLQTGSEDRTRLDEEFDFLASVEGLDSAKIDETTRKRLQLTALRAVYGPLDAVTKRTAPKTETHQGLPGGARINTDRKNPDQTLLDNLTKTEVNHYQKMFRTGRYPNGWKDVVAELKFEVPKKARR